MDVKDLFGNPVSGAEMREDSTHRLALWRVWDIAKPLLLFVGLNPSTANESKNDPTITRLIGFAKALGCGRLAACNLFSLVSPKPSALKSGQLNLHHEADEWIRKFTMEALYSIVAWGEPGKEHPERVASVLNMLHNPLCFGRNVSGQPKHPLYLPKNAHENLTPFKKAEK